MAIKRPRKETKKPASAGGSSLVMVEMPHQEPDAGADQIHRPPLPPGVYFSPTKEECLGFLNRSIAGDSVLPDARGYIVHANVYGESPDVLRQRHPPASTREGDHTWWFLSQTRFQSPTSRTQRADRRVGKNVGYWRLDQSKKKLEDAGFKNCFGFYTGTSKSTDKAGWLMHEFTSAKDDGAGKRGVPALYRVYLSPHATVDQVRETYGEDGIKKWPDGTKKPVRAVVPEEYFDAIAKLLPQGSVRQEHAALPQAPPPPPVVPAGLLDYHGQHGQSLGQYNQQQGQYLGQYYHRQQHEHWASPGVDICGQYQQQGPFSHESEVATPLLPPAAPSLRSEVAADMPSNNLSISMAELTGMCNEQPMEAVEEEPDRGSLDNIVDDGEFKKFNKEG